MFQLLIALVLTFSAAALADESARLKEANFPAQWQDGSQVM